MTMNFTTSSSEAIRLTNALKIPSWATKNSIVDELSNALRALADERAVPDVGALATHLWEDPNSPPLEVPDEIEDHPLAVLRVIERREAETRLQARVLAAVIVQTAHQS
ncbi:unnamed protein product [Caenorhabditis sp. 36 PRJEB53466]|nr:unnamed protein product [Caenorhabditis sp. 36 PRJEB53466]